MGPLFAPTTGAAKQQMIQQLHRSVPSGGVTVRHTFLNSKIALILAISSPNQVIVWAQFKTIPSIEYQINMCL